MGQLLPKRSKDNNSKEQKSGPTVLVFEDKGRWCPAVLTVFVLLDDVRLQLTKKLHNWNLYQVHVLYSAQISLQI